VSYNSIHHAQEAIQTLNGSSINGNAIEMCMMPSSLLLAPPRLARKSSADSTFSEGGDSRSNKVKFNNTDIEITMPAPRLNLVISTSPLTPTSISSPCFPDISSNGSPRSPVGHTGEIPIESPVSVAKLPMIGDKWDDFAAQAMGGRNALRKQERREEERRAEEGKKVEKGEKKKCEMKRCEVCQREVKKKSFAAHQKTKIHLNSQKMLS
jgi:hypothetical protein